MTVRSPKTEDHPDGEFRIVPIFPELMPYLRDARELAKPSADYVITRYRDSKTNLRTQLTKIIRRAGLKPWPKLWQNLRSTRETELAEQFPLSAVCGWIGNSEAVARRHYLQMRDVYFEQATGLAQATQIPTQQRSATPRRVQKTGRYESVTDGGKEAPSTSGHKNLRTIPSDCYKSFAPLDLDQVGGTGLEPATSTV